MSSFHYEGKKIYYEEIGNGKPLLLLHGNTACGKMFAPILPMLSEKHHVSQTCEKLQRSSLLFIRTKFVKGYYFFLFKTLQLHI